MFKWIDSGVDGAVNYFSKPSTGGALKIKTLKTLIDNSYQRKGADGKIKAKQQNIDGYELDKDLTTDTNAVYYHPTEKRVVNSIRGTNGTASDWLNNGIYICYHLRFIKKQSVIRNQKQCRIKSMRSTRMQKRQ